MLPSLTCPSPIAHHSAALYYAALHAQFRRSSPFTTAPFTHSVPHPSLTLSRNLHSLCHPSPCIPPLFTLHYPCLHSRASLRGHPAALRPSLLHPALPLYTTQAVTLFPVPLHSHPALHRFSPIILPLFTLHRAPLHFDPSLRRPSPFIPPPITPPHSTAPHCTAPYSPNRWS
jgi:hypothetical protein